MSFLLKNPTPTEGVQQWDAQTQSYCVIQDPLIELRDEFKKILQGNLLQTEEMKSEVIWEEEGEFDVQLGWEEALNFVITTINTKIKEVA